MIKAPFQPKAHPWDDLGVQILSSVSLCSFTCYRVKESVDEDRDRWCPSLQSDQTATFWAHIADKKALWKGFFHQWIQSLINVFPSHSQVQLKTEFLSNFRSLLDWLFFHPEKGILGFSTSFIHQHHTTFPKKQEPHVTQIAFLHHSTCSPQPGAMSTHLQKHQELQQFGLHCSETLYSIGTTLCRRATLQTAKEGSSSCSLTLHVPWVTELHTPGPEGGCTAWTLSSARPLSLNEDKRYKKHFYLEQVRELWF